ncbi:hypothetical protein COV15_00980 [Candidatus Woesearchaeota archaeon CG10_big_fil_rev_8_21_14_0_10_34_12]|nr:MAG: hypothetical protein COV15_00980 [Candidatus Woesearchaeota archaeon CG10_big_fil_rev_8_21_14_0_10_34_12]
MQEKENVLDILKGVRTAVKDDDSRKLRELSDRTIHSSSIFQDGDNIAVAVIVYSLAKILERKNYRGYGGWKGFLKKYMKNIDWAIKALENDNLEDFREAIKAVRLTINGLSGSFKLSIQELFKKAEINKASRIYEHGVSMEATAKLLGISMWDLAEYAGNTGIGDVDLGVTMPEKQRVKLGMEIF